ncbi:hypothetical protein [Bacillus xiapuensis]|uniref:hypothetical protein n=1 Tax=Bacillus xiapuensis TaxID=2014075 RepID=UPI0012FD4A75|nr:hypothetical protein [Bacillus xiapuensis]
MVKNQETPIYEQSRLAFLLIVPVAAGRAPSAFRFCPASSPWGSRSDARQTAWQKSAISSAVHLLVAPGQSAPLFGVQLLALAARGHKPSCLQGSRTTLQSAGLVLVAAGRAPSAFLS